MILLFKLYNQKGLRDNIRKPFWLLPIFPNFILKIPHHPVHKKFSEIKNEKKILILSSDFSVFLQKNKLIRK
jgi:hypothetical protein